MLRFYAQGVQLTKYNNNGLQLIYMFKLWYLFMMETIANSELHIPTPIHPTH